MREDDYGIDERGNIKLIRKTEDKFDRLIALDNDGKETETTVNVEKNVLNNIKKDKSLSGKQYSFLNVKDKERATTLFEFVSDNTKVEWSLIKTDKKGNFISTSHDYQVEGGNPHIMAKLYRDGVGVTENIHSHPGQFIAGPSGFRMEERSLPASDRKQAESMRPYFPNTVFKVYRVFQKKYTRYDEKRIYQ